MSQLDEKPFFCKMVNLDLNRNIGDLALFEPMHHWSEDPKAIRIGVFDPRNIGLDPGRHENGLVLEARVGRDTKDSNRSIYWLPTWNLILAKDQKNECLCTQLEVEVLEALKQQAPRRVIDSDSQWIETASSTVRFVRYIDVGDMGNALDVIFHSSDQIYRFNDVGQVHFKRMMQAASVGTYFANWIKGKFPFVKFDFDEKDPRPY